MFERIDPPNCTITWQDREIPARIGESLAAALLAAGISCIRVTRISGASRGPFCMMGTCFDCLVTVEGEGSRQACMVPVVAGMRAYP